MFPSVTSHYFVVGTERGWSCCFCVLCLKKDLIYTYSFSVGGRMPRILYQGRDFLYYFSLPSGDPTDDYKGEHKSLIYVKYDQFFKPNWYTNQFSKFVCLYSDYLYWSPKQHVRISDKALSRHSPSRAELRQKCLLFLFSSWAWFNDVRHFIENSYCLHF